MPEGHVIHRLARMLNSDFAGHEIKVSSPQGRFATEAAALDGHTIDRAEAFGKHLFIHFDADDPAHIVYIHLGLIGQLRFEPSENLKGQIRLRIDNGTTAAQLRGPQWCRLITDEEYDTVMAKVGEDPIRDDAEPAEVWAKVQRSRRTIASLLMDQKLFAGVGNIYRAEVLFRQDISPFVPGSQLTREQFDAIWDDLVVLMRDGVKVGEINTVREAHLPDVMGRAARDDEHGGEVYVYRREGLPCYVCGTAVKLQQMEGRNLFWCPTCQK